MVGDRGVGSLAAMVVVRVRLDAELAMVSRNKGREIVLS